MEGVRGLQRAYIELWIDSLAALVAEDRDALRLRVQACFGLLNSTPHSTSTALRARVDTARLLTAMAGGNGRIARVSQWLKSSF